MEHGYTGRGGGGGVYWSPQAHKSHQTSPHAVGVAHEVQIISLDMNVLLLALPKYPQLVHKYYSSQV